MWKQNDIIPTSSQLHIGHSFIFKKNILLTVKDNAGQFRKAAGSSRFNQSQSKHSLHRCQLLLFLLYTIV